MKLKNWLIASICCGMLMVSGCQKQKEEVVDPTKNLSALSSGEYAATIPFQTSTSRQQHVIRSISLSDTMYIGTGLLDYAKEYFSPDKYTMQEGEFLAFDELASLLGRESDNNPDGLNPASDTNFDTGNGIVKAPVLIRDIYEIDFRKDKEIKGIAIAIVLNQSVSENGSGEKDVIVKDDILKAYGEDTARKLITHMRKIPEIGDTMPIYVALYKDSGQGSTLPGTFFSQAYFEGRTGSFSAINEQWVYFPSNEASKLDANTATQFSMMKNSLNGFLPDDVGIIGQGKFVDGVLKELRIDVSMYAKSATEAISATQYVKSLLQNFTSLEYEIKVQVKCENEVIATMIREIGSKDVQVNTLI